MSHPSSIEHIARWAKSREDLGPGVYQITSGRRDHRHAYYTINAWSPDQSSLLLLRHDREKTAAEVCVLSTATGEIRKVGTSTRWNAHAGAFQQWLGTTGRLFYVSHNEEGNDVVVTVNADGSDERVIPTPGITVWQSAVDGRHVFATTNMSELFGPDDSIAPRHDKGIVRVDLETGKQEVIFSLEDALALHPERDRIKDFHLNPKQIVTHPTGPRIFFNLVNQPWDLSGREDRTRGMYSLDEDGGYPAYVGSISDHPQWDPKGDRIVANVRDMNGKRRFGIYPGDGDGLLYYVPETPGSGHPSLSHCGLWVCSDGRGLPDGRSGMVLAHVQTGREILAVSAQHHSQNASFKNYRDLPEDQSLMSVQSTLIKGNRQRWTTHLHPTWSRDGKTVLFNVDETDAASQLFVLDVEAALRAGESSPPQ